MKTCRYKGRQYELKLTRTFEWGEKACLRFLNAKPEDKDFWVKSEFISDVKDDGIEKPKDERKPQPKTVALAVGEPCPTCGKVYTHDDDSIPF